MSSARLEVITDDANIAPRVSRTLPAALYGIIPTTTYQTFCEKLDTLFELLYTEQRRRKKRFWWIYGAIYLWFMYFVVFAPLIFNVYGNDYDDDNDTDSSTAAKGFVPLCLCIIHICTVWACTARPTGVKTDGEIMRDIRIECEEMTNHTPMVSFHVVMMPVPTVARGSWLQMSTVDHIAVSISPSAMATGAATIVSTVMENEKVYGTASTTDTDNNEPVVYAKAVSNGGYEQVATGSGVELV